MKVGIGSYAFAWAIGVPGYPPPERPMDAFGLIDAAAELGAEAVQVCDNLPVTAVSASDWNALSAHASAAGLALEIGTRGIDDHLLGLIDTAARIGSPFVRLVVDCGDDRPGPDEVVRRLTPVAAAAAARGVRIAIENHDRFAARTLRGIVEHLGSDRAGVCLDTVNSLGALEGPDVVLAELAPLTVSLHVKDFTIRRADHQMGFIVEGCPAGLGRLDIPRVLAALGGQGRPPLPEGSRYHGPPRPWSAPNAILEQWVPPAETMAATIARERAWAAESMRYLRAAALAASPAPERRSDR